MKLISEDGTQIAADDFLNELDYDNDYDLSIESFKAGVSFAETELQNVVEQRDKLLSIVSDLGKAVKNISTGYPPVDRILDEIELRCQSTVSEINK